MTPCGEAPYTGANRIRFQGYVSADAILRLRHPRFKPPLKHVPCAIVHDRCFVEFRRGRNGPKPGTRTAFRGPTFHDSHSAPRVSVVIAQGGREVKSVGQGCTRIKSDSSACSIRLYPRNSHQEAWNSKCRERGIRPAMPFVDAAISGDRGNTP
jgi:hypothetical protein